MSTRDVRVAADLARIQHWATAGVPMGGAHLEKGPDLRYGDSLEGLDPAGGIVGLLKLEVVTLTATQLKALNATPVQVVAAAPTGYANILLACVLHYDAGATPYTINGSTNLLVKMKANGSGDTLTVARLTTGFIDQATDQISNLKLVATNDTLLTGADSAMALTLAVASPTAGNGVLRVQSLISQVKLY